MHWEQLGSTTARCAIASHRREGLLLFIKYEDIDNEECEEERLIPVYCIEFMWVREGRKGITRVIHIRNYVIVEVYAVTICGGGGGRKKPEAAGQQVTFVGWCNENEAVWWLLHNGTVMIFLFTLLFFSFNSWSCTSFCYLMSVLYVNCIMVIGIIERMYKYFHNADVLLV